MRPVNGRRRLALLSSRRSAVFVVPILVATLLAAALLLTLRTAAAAAAPGSAQPAAKGYTASNNGGDDNGGDDEDSGRRKRDEIVGVVVAVPSSSPDGYQGAWRIVVGSRTVVTVVVDAQTEIEDFTAPPGVGAWVEVRGTPQPNGSVLARRLRPNEFESGEVVVRLAASDAITGVQQRYDLELVDTLLASANIYLLASDEDIQEDDILAEMRRDRSIKWAELNYVSEVPSDPEGNPYRTWKWGSSDSSGYINQGALQQVNLLPAAGRYDGAGVVVAVLDTGIDASHPALAGRLLAGRDMVNDDAVPQDGPEAGEEPGLAQGHGTHVSGIIARVAPQSKLLPVRVLDVNGRGNTYVLAYAIEWAAEQGAGVINLSLGADFDSQVLSNAIAAAEARGAVIVAAAGNESSDAPQYPANFPGVIGVTAVDGDGRKADFANYGASWVDLASPGVGITSTVPLSGEILYATWSGTSMATPFVSGAAALVKQKQPGASPRQVSESLITAGGSLDAANPQYAGQLGRMLDIGAALGMTPSVPITPVTPVTPVTPTLPSVYLPALMRP